MATRGVTLLVLGSDAYGKFAFNMALSLKRHKPTLPVQLVYQESALKRLDAHKREIFDIFTPIADEDCHNEAEKLCPGKAKMSLYKYLAFDETIVLDVDGLCVDSLDRIFEACAGKGYASQVVGAFTEKDAEWTCQWMPLKNVKKHFFPKKPFRVFEINSSFQFIRKGAVAEKLYKQAMANYAMPIPAADFGNTWGGTFPDELAMNVAFGQTGIDPTIDFAPVYFRAHWEKTHSGIDAAADPLKWITARHCLIGLYGHKGFNHHSIENDYDGYYRRLCDVNWEAMGYGQNSFKPAMLMEAKHANKKN